MFISGGYRYAEYMSKVPNRLDTISYTRGSGATSAVDLLSKLTHLYSAYLYQPDIEYACP